MNTPIKTGHLIGVLLLVQVIFGSLDNFAFTAPLCGKPGFLINAAPHANQIAFSALLGIGMGVLSLAIASLLYPIFKPYSQPMALFYFGLVTAGVALTVVENTKILSMLSLSQAYVAAGASQEALYQGLRIVVKDARNWTHYLSLLVSGVTIFTFYFTTLRFKLLPIALSIFGILAALSQLTAIAMPLFGRDVDFRLIAPLGICEMLLRGWLIVKGCRESAGVPGEGL